MMKSATTPNFAAGWTALVGGLAYLVVAHRSLARQVLALRQVQATSPGAETPVGKAGQLGRLHLLTKIGALRDRGHDRDN
ncbi:hypothetical protein [Streptomyces graminilatus]|uniref:hypothetical protein n=1 Tax=Streptomyces graminilatus TaxID=1464070 RepID=UPI0012FEF376|nr:hypothetical protein [Streptomyces graminilatus]